MQRYPFWNVAPGTPDAEAIEEIDIGGVSLLRAAAKNFAHVSVLTHPSQYRSFCEQSLMTTIEERRQLAQTAFTLTSRYDTCIASHFSILQDHLASVAIPERFERSRSTGDVPLLTPAFTARSAQTQITRVYTKISQLKYFGVGPDGR